MKMSLWWSIIVRNFRLDLHMQIFRAYVRMLISEQTAARTIVSLENKSEIIRENCRYEEIFREKVKIIIMSRELPAVAATNNQFITNASKRAKIVRKSRGN